MDTIVHSFWIQNALPAACCLVGLPLMFWKIWKDFRDNNFPMPQIFVGVFWLSILFFWQIGDVCGYINSVDIQTAKIHYMVAGAILSVVLIAIAIALGITMRKRARC